MWQALTQALGVCIGPRRPWGCDRDKQVNRVLKPRNGVLIQVCTRRPCCGNWEAVSSEADVRIGGGFTNKAKTYLNLEE